MILCIETATMVCSVALCNETGTAMHLEAESGMTHASQLTVLIQRLMEECSVKPESLNAVAVSKGPGSYTGLRIGVSVAKGIAYGTGIPLIAVNTLESMCAGFIESQGISPDQGTLLCPMIDARRMEVYNALFTSEGKMIRPTTADIIDSSSYSKELADNRMIFFGNGADKCSQVIMSDNARFVTGFRLSASYLCLPSLDAFREKRFEDLAYFEPYYLKEFIATVPGKLLP